MKTSIPEEFYKGDKHPVVRTVAQLKKQLSRLPDDLPIDHGFGVPEMVVFNMSSARPHLEFREHEED